MDFHNMKRRELQKLCKKHDISANLSNLDMVDKLSSLFKVKGKEEGRPLRKTRSCLKNCDEILSETESDVLKRKSKKVRFSPQNDVFQLGEKSERSPVVENRGVVGRITRDRAKLAKTILISPVVMKKKGKRAVQEVEKVDLVDEDKGGTSRVTRGRATLGKSVVIASPVVMKKRGKRALQADEKGDLAVENWAGVSRVTRARGLLGEKVLTSPVVMKKRSKKAVQEDEKSDMVVENKGGASRVTRARAGKQVLISSPVVMKKRGKKAVQEDFFSPPLEEENEVVNVKFLRNRKVENVLSPKKIARNRSTQKGSQGVTAEVLENKDAEADAGITQPKMGTRRSARNVSISEESMDETDQKVSRKNLRQSTRQRASAKSNIEDVDKKTVAGEISEPEVVTKQSKRNRMVFTQVEPSEENLGATEKAGRRKITPSRNQFQAKASTVGGESETRDASEEVKEVVIQVKEPLRRSGRHVNTEHTNFDNDSEMPIESDKYTQYQTRRSTRRMSVMPQIKKAKIEKPVSGKLAKKNIVVKGYPNESTKPIVQEKGSETGDIRRSKRNASGDGSLAISEDANGSETNIKTGTTKKRKRDAILEEVPLQHTGTRVNVEADNISDKLEKETPVASETRTRSGNRQNSLMQSAKKLNISGNLGPSSITGEKTSPHHTRELSSVPKRPATGVRQSKTVAVTPRTRSGSGQKSSIHTTKKLRMSGNSGLRKTIGDKESPHQSRELSMVPKHSETESKARGSKSKETPVIQEHSRRFTRSALKGKTDGPAYVRGKIYQKKSQSVSKLPLPEVESSLPKIISASEGQLDIDVQSSDHEVDRSTVNLVSNASDLPEDKTACLTPQGGSAKTSSVDLNMQESEGPELINIHEALPSDPLKLQSDHAELEVDISDGGHAPERPASYDVQSTIPQIAGCSTDPMSDASNSCRDIDSCEILQDRATEANDKTPVNVKPAEGSDVPGDVAFIDRNCVDDGFSSVEQITSKGMEVNPQTIKNVEPNLGGTTNIVLEGTTVREESMNQLLFPEDGCITISVSKTGDANEDNTIAKKREKSSEINVESPHLVHLKADDAAGDAFPVDTNALADISLVDQSTSTRTEEWSQLSKDAVSISKGIDLNLVFQGHAIHEDESVPQSPLVKVAGITDNPVTGNNDAACVTQQEGPTEIYAKSPSLVHVKSVDNVDMIGDAGSIDSGSVDDLSNAEQINLSAIKEKQEGSKNDNHVVAEGSTVNEEKLTAEQEDGVRNTSAEFAESGGFDKDFISASKEVSEGSFADPTNQTVPMIFTADKDDTMHAEMSVQANEPHNTSSKSRMQEKEFPVPNSMLTTEQVSILEYELSQPEFSDTVMCSNKEFAEDSNQRPSTVESSLMGEESCRNKCIEFSTSKVVAESVARGNNKSEPEAPSSPLCGTEVGNRVVEVNEELKPEDSPSNLSSDIFERATVDESSVAGGNNKSEPEAPSSPLCGTEVGDRVVEVNEEQRPEDSPSKCGTEVGDCVVEVNEELRPEDSPSNWSSDIFERAAVDEISVAGGNIKSEPEAPSSPLCGTEVGDRVVEVNEELKPEDSPSNWSSDIFERVAVDESSFQKEQSSFLSADVSDVNQSKNAKDQSEIRKKVNVFDSSIRKMSDMPEFISSLPSHATEVGHPVAEVKELKPEDSSSLRSTEIIPERAAEDGSSLHRELSAVILADGSEHNNQSEDGRDESEIRQRVNMINSRTSDFNFGGGKWAEDELGASSISLKKMVPFEFDTELINKGEEYSAVGIEGIEVEETVCEDTVENDSGKTSSMYGDAHHISDSQLPMEKEWDMEEATCSISVDVEERRMNNNITRERTPVISEDDVDRDGNPYPGTVHKFPSNVDNHCHTPSEESGKEQGTDMSMVKSSRNFGKEFSSQHDYCHRPLKDSCGKEKGTPMSMVKSTYNCEEFSGQHDNIIEQIEICSDADLPQDICDDFARFENQLVANHLVSTGRQPSRIGSPNNEKIEEIEPCTVTTDKIVLEEGIESLKGNSSYMVRNLVEGSGGYCEKSDAEINTYDISEGDRYGKDTIESPQFEDTSQQFDMTCVETDSNLKGMYQENDGRPNLVQMDVDTSNNVEGSRGNLIAVDAIQRFDQEADDSGVPTEELVRNEDDGNAPANLEYGGESATLTGETYEAEGVLAEKIPRNEDAIDADASAKLQYCHESLTGKTNEAQEEQGPVEFGFFSGIFGPEFKSRSDEMDGEESDLWYGGSSYILDKGEDAGKGVDIFTVSPTKEQMHNSGEEHVREKGTESKENQHASFKNHSTGDDYIWAENSVAALSGTHLECETSKDSHQKVDGCDNNKFDENSKRTES